MTKEELAARLDGADCRRDIPAELVAAAEQAGLVILFGAGDDLVELRGAVDDEAGAGDGTVVRVDTEGILPAWESLDLHDRGIQSTLRDWFRREGGGCTVTARWDRGDGVSWSYETAIPHATFRIVEDGDTFCIGIVFSMADCGRKM